MRIPDETHDQLAVKLGVLFPHLDERQRRLLAAAEARILGQGGIRAVARAAGVSETTIRRGMSDLEAGESLVGRVRRSGGGRKRVTDLDPGLRSALLALVEPDEREEPMPPLRWTTRSTRTLAAELTRQGHRVGADTVAGLLRQEGFRLQANAKTLEGSQHADQDAQFRYLNEQAREHQDAGQPVISVDTKKKNSSATSTIRAVPGCRRATRCRYGSTTSPIRSWAKPSLTASTTWRPTPAGSTSAPTTTPPRSRWSRSAAGGTTKAGPLDVVSYGVIIR